MGAVYQARDIKRRGMLCAIKEMSLALVPPEEQAQAIQNFKIEAKMLWGLSHPNLPAFTNFFAENQRYFLVMEYIDGHTLEELLERQSAPFPERHVLRWAEELCDVLAYLHSQNPPIIFRDMKPGNVMLTRQGHVKLIDFGIARFFRPTRGPDTRLLGTPGYAPPEQYGTAQTDERSDIYSLGMTLFHLLTNTLSEKGFGVKVKDVWMANPQVWLPVAQALEQATALEPAMRYENVAAFRLALCGAESFRFETGETATEPQGLAELCAYYPKEAAQYLANGEIDSWLDHIGEAALARATRRIRAMYADPLESVEQFLRVIVGPNARIRGDAVVHANGYAIDDENDQDTKKAKASLPDRTPKYQGSLPPIFTLNRHASLQVSPRRLDFGPVYPSGLSAPLGITISGYQGLRVSGSIRVSEPWIKIERTAFDGMNTYVNVRIQTAQLKTYMHYQGSIVIAPSARGESEIMVTIDADIQGYSALAGRRPGKTVTLDEDEEDDAELAMSTAVKSAEPQLEPEDERDVSAEAKEDISDDLIIKYGQAKGQERWEPCPATPMQLRCQQFGLAVCAASMMGSLWYICLSQLPFTPLPPNPWFIIVLTGMVPATTLGALFTNHDNTWLTRAMIDRIITGMGCALTCLAPAHLLWQTALKSPPGWLQLAVMLMVAALGAVIGTTTTVHKQILAATAWLLKLLRYQSWPLVVLACILGGLLGSLLSVILTASGFTLLGMLFGMGISVALVWRVGYLLSSNKVEENQ
jgi:serine/threonine protein kinase